MIRDAERDSTAAYILLGFALIVGAVLTGYAIAGSTDSPSTPHAADEPGFVVELEENGDATVVVSYTFDLDDDERSQAFEELRDSETDRKEFRERFESRLSEVADDASAATNREMSVSDAEITFETVDGTGVVRLSVTWSGLAEASDDDLVVTEPFASGFVPDRPFHVVLPDSHEVRAITPSPDDRADEHLTWEPDTPLDGFELVVSPVDVIDERSGDDSTAEEGDSDRIDEEGDDGSTDEEVNGVDDDGSGFGLTLAVVGALAALLALAQRQ